MNRGKMPRKMRDAASIVNPVKIVDSAKALTETSGQFSCSYTGVGLPEIIPTQWSDETNTNPNPKAWTLNDTESQP